MKQTKIIKYLTFDKCTKSTVQVRLHAEELNVKRTILAGEINMPFIGSVRTMFSKRFGTPRQGSLAESTLGIVQLDKQVLGDGALEGLETYSHAWLLFYFHENSDEHKLNVLNSTTANAKKTFKGKIRPPGMLGAKTGVLSTRSPHRPSRLGLSLVKIVEVDLPNRRLVVSGVDLLDQTPIFDIKPFVPADVPVGEIRYPDWVGKRANDGRSQDDAPLVVDFSDEAKFSLQDILHKSNYTKMFLTSDVEKACEVLRQALRLDIRAVYHDRYEVSDREFHVTFCEVGVHFVVGVGINGDSRPRLVVNRIDYDTV